jgi:hypothetical protein
VPWLPTAGLHRLQVVRCASDTHQFWLPIALSVALPAPIPDAAAEAAGVNEETSWLLLPPLLLLLLP